MIRTHMRVAPAAVALALGAGFGTVSCGKAEEPAWSEPRVLEPSTFMGRDDVRFGIPTRERFGYAETAAPAGVPPPQAASELVYDLPAGWVERPATSMRVLNLGLLDEPAAEITLTFLAGDGGGLAANANRWRAQLGLPPLDAASLAGKTPTRLLGNQAVRFDARGDYTGMGTTAQADFRMLGVLAVSTEGSAFLKFTGPAARVAAEEQVFFAWAESLKRRGEGQTEAPAPSSEAPAPTPEEPAPNTADGIAFEVPEGWRRGPARTMRAVTFFAGPDGEVECYITILGGDGGGLKANLDRWRGEMGAAPLSEAEIAQLERIPSVGGDAVLIDVSGNFRGMGPRQQDDALMLGAVALTQKQGHSPRAVFVKLVGPKAAAEQERAHFRAFVSSLEDIR